MSVERVMQGAVRPRPMVTAPRRRRVHLGPPARGYRDAHPGPATRPVVPPNAATATQCCPTEAHSRCFTSDLLSALSRRWAPATRQAVFTMVPLIAFGAISWLAGPLVGAIMIASVFGGAAVCRWLDRG